ncbi:MAG TPA: dCMP deaminase family protein [Nitrospira sp.]|nr:dCMP deaminase family protein [Nitrospira sp.]
MSPDKAAKFMEVARAISKFSKDSSTQVGAIVVGPAMEIRSLGYNGAPRGCPADEADDPRSTMRPEKYFWFSHAELNAVTNAARVGTPLDGCVLLVTHPPCMDCARAIVQAGIRKVITLPQEAAFYNRWQEHIVRSMKLFEECGVELVVLEKK